MNPSKIILSNGDHDEYTLGTYNQGVVFEFDLRGQVDVIDVASGDVVAIQDDSGWRWGREIGPYSKLFVQSVDKRTIYKHPEQSDSDFLQEITGHSIRYDPVMRTRAKNALLRKRLRTLEEVSQWTKSELINNLPNFGRKCADEVELALQAHGLDYREET